LHKSIVPGTAIAVSRFIFGTGSFVRGGAARRQRLLHAAVEAGFTHFDTAPYYGFGLAERDLRPVLAAHRHVTVTTKVGLYAPGGENQREWGVVARKALGRMVPAVARPRTDFGVDRARRSLDASLRRLGRERAELYLLHEADPDLLATDAWCRFLEDARRDGKVAAFGIAVSTPRLRRFLAADHALAGLVQTPDSLAAREADVLAEHGRPLQITHGYVGAAVRAAAGAPIDVEAVLRAALARNAQGAIVVHTSKPERLAQFAAVAS
jgi:D-threo-aldose 1-dehydrogenase